MLQELITLFEKAYDVSGDKLILDNYILKTGVYIRVDTQGTITTKRIYDKKKGRIEESDYRWFCERDYLSNLLDMNKPIDPKKKIHSNNYMSFFIKKDIVIGEKALDKKYIQERIEEYYRILADPTVKYGKKPKALELYNTIKDEIDQDKLNGCASYIKNNLWQIIDGLMNEAFDNYIKIFFDVPVEEYHKESKRYNIPNLYNDNKYNVEIDGAIYGLTNNNMGLNSKKPYLEHKTRVISAPCLVKSSDILMHKKFFDWLGTQKRGSLYIKHDSDFILGVTDHLEEESDSYYYLELEQGTGPEIMNFDVIPRYDSDTELLVHNYLQTEEKIDDEWIEIDTIELNKRYQIEDYIDDIWYNKKLKRHYYTDAKDIKKLSQPLKQYLLATRQAFYNYFKLSDDNGLSNIMRYGVKLAKLHLLEGHWLRAAKAMNLYIALSSQKGGKEDMPGILEELRQELNLKIQQSDTVDCSNDKEFYFLTGQVVRYLLTKTKAKDKNVKHGMVNGFLECRNSKQLKKEVKLTFQKYNHEIYMNHRAFNNAMAMIQSYTPEQHKIDDEMFITGYTASNVLMKKGEKTDE